MNKFAVAFAALGLLATAVSPAQAVVYCKTVGVPKGCVARPVVGAPGVGAPGVGVRPGVGVGAPGVGVTRGAGVGAGPNAGGPVNRVGVR